MSQKPIASGPEALQKLLDDVKHVRDALAMNMLCENERDSAKTLFDAERILTAANAAVDDVLGAGPALETETDGDGDGDSTRKVFLAEINHLVTQMLDAKAFWGEWHDNMNERVARLNEKVLAERRPWEEPDLTPWGQFLEDGAPGVPNSYQMIAHNYETLQIIPEQGIDLIMDWEDESDEVLEQLGLGESQGPSDFHASTYIDEHFITPNPYVAEAGPPPERRGDSTVVPLPQIANYLDRFSHNQTLWVPTPEDGDAFPIERVLRLSRSDIS